MSRKTRCSFLHYAPAELILRWLYYVLSDTGFVFVLLPESACCFSTDLTDPPRPRRHFKSITDAIASFLCVMSRGCAWGWSKWVLSGLPWPHSPNGVYQRHVCVCLCVCGLARDRDIPGYETVCIISSVVKYSIKNARRSCDHSQVQ